MAAIFFTSDEKGLLTPLVERRLALWQQEKITDAGSKKRFKRSYLVPLQAALTKILSGTTTSYTLMEKSYFDWLRSGTL